MDACSTQAQQRARWLTVARRTGATPYLHVVHCPLELALARNVGRPHPVPESVLTHYAWDMRRALRQVEDEGWAHITYLEVAEQVGDPDPMPITRW